MESNYRIPEINIAPLQALVEKLNKRAAKLGCAPVVLTVGEFEEVAVRTVDGCETGKRRRVYAVTVTGEAPKLNGWIFAAVLQRIEAEDGSEMGLLRTVPGQTAPESFRARVGECDHCRADRRRNDVFVVRNDAGEYKVVGSTCLWDFLGHEDPHGAAQMAELLAELAGTCEGAEEEEFFGGGRVADRWSVDSVLTKAAAVVRVSGFVSRKKAQEGFGLVATADTLSRLLCTRPVTQAERDFFALFAGEDSDKETAETAREWARGFAGSENDYLYNLSVVARSASVTPREFGLGAAMISSYKREIAQRAESALETSQHFGTVGERLTVSVVFESCRESGGDWGLTTICRYRTTDGNLATWFASGTPDPALTVVGATIVVDATVKSHGEFRGVKQTTITRVKLHVEKAKKARKSRAQEVSL